MDTQLALTLTMRSHEHALTDKPHTVTCVSQLVCCCRMCGVSFLRTALIQIMFS